MSSIPIREYEKDTYNRIILFNISWAVYILDKSEI